MDESTPNCSDRDLMADIVVIGGGIAGASAAFELAASASVIVLEREPHCGYHSTGRSAASFTENYGGVVIRRLAVGSRNFLQSPPADFSEFPLLSPRGMITIAHAGQLELLAQELETARRLVPSIVPLSLQDAFEWVPALRRDYVAGAIVEPHCMDLDVNGIHQGYLRGARNRGAKVIVNAGVERIERIGEGWKIGTAAGTFFARIIVNAGGAWADRIAELAGLPALGLVPKRRTAFNVAAPPGIDIGAWPMVNDAAEEFYFKPDAGQLFVSPADATPSEPTDAFPEDLDVALGVERLERATTIQVDRVARSWAGLRTFAPDGAPVVGFDSAGDGFFWLAAQGGYGIKTSPALSRACASLIGEGRLPADLLSLGITAGELSPDRLRNPRSPEPFT